jgi:hypothetical protein
MSVPKALQRLLRIRGLEEEQRRLELEAAIAGLQSLEQAREAAAQMHREARAHIAESAISGELVDRVAGLVETDTARAWERLLEPRIEAAEMETTQRRREFLQKRIERRQAATLIEEAAARDDVELERRSRQSIDEWFGTRLHRQADSEEQG